jgi:tetratricopeptide (TPR) repeat protein
METSTPTSGAAEAFALANSMAELGEINAAVDAYRQCLKLAPDCFPAHYNLGNAYIKTGRLVDAVESFVACLRIAPEFGAAYVNLAETLRALGLLEQAQGMAELGVQHLPGMVEAKTCLASILHDRSEFAMAETLYREALKIAPDNPGALSNLGNTLHAMGRVSEAVARHDQAVSIAPDEPEFHFSLATALLASGDYARGWGEYEWRWLRSQAKPRGFGERWQGEDLTGRTILLHAEQGLGDTLQFVRYAPLVAKRDGRVILEVQAPLVRLMQNLPGMAKVIARGEDLPDFDTHCPLLSLPHVFATRTDTIPAGGPYLRANPAEVANWRMKLPASDGSLRVGLVWAGSAHVDDAGAHLIDQRRSLKFTDFAPLLDLPNVHFVSLQKHEAERITNPMENRVLDLMSAVTDFADTAALVANLDLVISVDTSVAHLAGGLGKPVWLLSRFDGCWRWLQNREDSPWYSNMRIYRQTCPHEWGPVVQRIRDDLATMLTPTPRCTNPVA